MFGRRTKPASKTNVHPPVEQPRGYGEEIETQIRTLMVMMRGARQDMEILGRRWAQLDADVPPYIGKKENLDRISIVQEARYDYYDSVDKYNDMGHLLEKLTGEKFNFVFPKEPSSFSVRPKPSAMRLRSTVKKLSRMPRYSSPIRRTGVTSCSQPRDPRTGRFVSC